MAVKRVQPNEVTSADKLEPIALKLATSRGSIIFKDIVTDATEENLLGFAEQFGQLCQEELVKVIKVENFGLIQE